MTNLVAHIGLPIAAYIHLLCEQWYDMGICEWQSFHRNNSSEVYVMKHQILSSVLKSDTKYMVITETCKYARLT